MPRLPNSAVRMLQFFIMFEIVYTCHLLHLLGAEIPLTSLDRILAYFYLAYLSEGVSGKKSVGS